LKIRLIYRDEIRSLIKNFGYRLSGQFNLSNQFVSFNPPRFHNLAKIICRTQHNHHFDTLTSLAEKTNSFRRLIWT